MTQKKPINSESLAKATTRIRELQAIGDNWDDEGSPAPTVEFGDAAVKLVTHICRHMPEGLTEPFVCPMPDGGLQVEWGNDGRHVEIEFQTPTKIIWLKDYDDEVDAEKCAASDLTELMGLVMWCFRITDTEKDKLP